MIELKHFVKGLLLICFTLGSVELKKKFPRIQDVVSFEEPNQHYIPSIAKKIKSSLDVDTLWRNEALFRSQIRGYLEDTTRESRRVRFNPGRINSQYELAFQYQFRTRILDCMLQLVYMARHWMKLFERAEYLDKTSITYRVAYLARRLKYFFHKARKILELLNIKQKNKTWNATYSIIAAPLNLHHKVAKLSVDFNYCYYLLKKLHAIYRPKEGPYGVQLSSYEDDSGGR